MKPTIPAMIETGMAKPKTTAKEITERKNAAKLLVSNKLIAFDIAPNKTYKVNNAKPTEPNLNQDSISKKIGSKLYFMLSIQPKLFFHEHIGGFPETK